MLNEKFLKKNFKTQNQITQFYSTSFPSFLQGNLNNPFIEGTLEFEIFLKWDKSLSSLYICYIQKEIY